MANLRILAYNIAETANGATMTDSPAMEATLPVTNLQLQTERERTAQSTSLASQDVKLTYASNQSANCMGLTRTNLTTGGTLGPRLYSDAAWTTGIYTPAASVAFSTAGMSAIGAALYRGRDFSHLRNTMLYFAEQTTIRSAIARIADASNPDGFMSATKLWLGKYFELFYNPPVGSAELTLMDSSTGARADDGTDQVDKGWKARRLVINLDYVNDATDLAALLDIANYLGLNRECFVSLYPGEGGAKEIYNQMACRIKSAPTFGPVQYGVHRNSLVFEET